MAEPRDLSDKSAAVNTDERRALVKVLDRAVDVQWTRAHDAVESLRRRNPHASTEDLAARVVRDFVRDMTVVGGLSGASAAVPGVGTVARIGVGMTAETAILLERSAFMILAVADIHGHELGDVEVRRFAILRVLGAWTGLTEGLTGVAGVAGAGLGRRATRAIPMPLIHSFNRRMGKPILFKWAAKSGTPCASG